MVNHCTAFNERYLQNHNCNALLEIIDWTRLDSIDPIQNNKEARLETIKLIGFYCEIRMETIKFINF